MSWFDQIDFTSLQDQLAKSVEEASAVISTVNRLEMLNLDDMAVQQEEEEKRRLQEEEDEGDDEEEEDEDVNDPTDDTPISSSISQPIDQAHIVQPSLAKHPIDLSSSSIDNLALESVVVTGSDIETGGPPVLNDGADQQFDDWPPILSPPPKPLVNEVSGAIKASGKKAKKKKDKHKKKKKHLDFFGIRSAQEDEEEEEEANNAVEDATNNNTDHGSKSRASNLESIFDISSLWDADGGVEDVPLDDPSAAHASNPASSSSKSSSATATDGNSAPSSTFMSDIFQSTTSALRVPVNIKIPTTTFSFFSNVDSEVDLENDPILKKVEENKKNMSHQGAGAGGGGIDYVAYFRALTGTTSAPVARTGAVSDRPSSVPRPAIPHSTYTSTGRLTGISSALSSDEEVTLYTLSSKLYGTVKDTSSTYAEKMRTIYTQFITISNACQITNIGSIFLHTTSMMYIFVQFVSVVVMYILRVLLYLVVYLVEVIIMGFRALLNMRQERLNLPCSIQDFQQRRQWVRDNVGSWANRVCQGERLRANYVIVIAIGIVLIFMFWKLQEYLDID